MKTFKKLGSLAIALALVLSTMLMSASAANFTVTGSTEGAEYKAYEVFELTHVDSNSDGVIDSGEPVSYSIDFNSKFYDTVSTFATAENGLVLKQVGSTTKYNVSFTSNYTTTKAAALAVLLNNDATKPDPTATAIVASGSTTATLSDAKLADGYFLITTTTGSNPMLYNIGTANMSKAEKNDLPTITKVADKESASIGEEVIFTIEVAIEEGAQSYIVEDTLPAGFVWDDTAKSTIAVKMADYDGGAYQPAATVTADNYTLTTDTDGFKVVFKQTYLDTLGLKDKLIVTYTAKLDTDAVIAGAGNKNNAVLTYGSASLQKNASDIVYSYAFDMVKTDGTKLLDGAKFKLYDELTGGNEIELILDGGVYRPVVNSESGTDIVVPNDAKVTIQGLATGTYYLEETATPTGYNSLEARQPVVINTANLTIADSSITGTAPNCTYAAGGNTGINIVNNTGALMPETGGIGTTVFYTVGSLLVVGAGILLITKKRMSSAN